MIFRTIFFVTLLILATSAPIVFLVIAACLYVAFYTGYELILLGLCIDSLYRSVGVFELPYYTLGSLVCVILFVWVKPRLLVYNR